METRRRRWMRSGAGGSPSTDSCGAQRGARCSATSCAASTRRRTSCSGSRARSSSARPTPTPWRRRRASSTRTTSPSCRPRRCRWTRACASSSTATWWSPRRTRSTRRSCRSTRSCTATRSRASWRRRSTRRWRGTRSPRPRRRPRHRDAGPRPSPPRRVCIYCVPLHGGSVVRGGGGGGRGVLAGGGRGAPALLPRGRRCVRGRTHPRRRGGRGRGRRAHRGRVRRRTGRLPLPGGAGDHADDGRDVRVRLLAADQHARGDGGALLVGRPQPGAPVPARARLHPPVHGRHAHHHLHRADARQLEHQQPQQRHRHHLPRLGVVHERDPAGHAAQRDAAEQQLRGLVGCRRRLRQNQRRRRHRHQPVPEPREPADHHQRRVPADVRLELRDRLHAVHQRRRRRRHLRRRLWRPARRHQRQPARARRRHVVRLRLGLSDRAACRLRARHLLQHLDPPEDLKRHDPPIHADGIDVLFYCISLPPLPAPPYSFPSLGLLG